MTPGFLTMLFYGLTFNLDKPTKIPHWRKPARIQWSDIPKTTMAASTETLSSEQGTIDHRYTNLCRDFEHYADRVLQENEQPPLLSRQKGRGVTTEVHWIPSTLPPLKRSRPGQSQPAFVGEHWQHAQWVRQLRRLQSFVQLQSKGTLTPTKRQHSFDLWRAILNANGFQTSFRKFWVQRSQVPPGGPVNLPKEPPPLEIARHILQSFQMEVTTLEQSLKRDRLKAAKDKRINDPNKIFQDVARPLALPVQTLVDQAVVTITNITEEGLIEYEPHTLSLDQPVLGPHGFLEYETHEHGKLQISPPPQVFEGDILRQHRLIGDLPTMFQRFQDLWEARWDRHRHVSEERWAPFLSFVQQHVPQPTQCMELPSITIDQWYQAVRAKKSKTAVGPDGFDKQDLLHMPKHQVATLLSILQTVENTGVWPRAMSIGLITALEKRPEAMDASHFRPITVLALGYRVWASIRAKQLLHWLHHIAPPGLCGNRQGHDTAMIWWHIAAKLEHSWHINAELSGTITDVIKCYNMIPRVPTFALAVHLKVPTGLIRPWFGAISQLERRFTIGGCTGPVCCGVTGFPEGDPLSVCSMFMINIAMYHWVVHHTSSAMLYTFVDNIEVTSDQPHETAASITVVREFCHLLDLELDAAKTICWAATPEGRQYLRHQGLTVALYGRDLGGHVAYCKQHTNSTVTERCSSLKTFWGLLLRSPATMHQKQKALQMCAWPRALHGASTVQLGPKHLQRLRSNAIRSFHVAQKGHSPILHLSFVCPTQCDPGFWLLRSTVMTFRRQCAPETNFHILDALVNDASGRSFPGPCHTFLERLHEINWSWHSDGWICDHDQLPLHITQSSIQHVLLRLEQGWQTFVGGLNNKRPSMAMMEQVDVPFSKQGINLLPLDIQGMLRVVMNGTFYTNNKLVHCNSASSPQCPWCDHRDSANHRHFDCPFMEDLRAQINPDLLEDLRQLPECTKQHGWFIAHPRSVQFRRALIDIPHTVRVFTAKPPEGHDLHLFTDGSCLRPAVARLRLATWAVVQANLQDDTFEEVSLGGVPGLIQTIGRAEFTAAISAVSYAVAWVRTAWIWTDNQQVFDTLQQYLRGDPPADIMSKDHDLHQMLWGICSQARFLGLLITPVKVKSHENETSYGHIVDRWAIRGNAAADELAATARGYLPSGLMTMWHELANFHDYQTQLRDNLRWLFVAVATRALDTLDDRQAIEDDCMDTQVNPEVPQDFPVLFEFLPHWTDRATTVDLGVQGETIFQWLRGLISPEVVEPVWLTTYQLLVDFQLDTKRLGPRFLLPQKSWTWMQHDNYDFLQAAAGLGRMLRRLGKEYDQPVTPAYRKPTGSHWAMWCRCFLMKVPAAKVCRINHVFQQFSRRPIQRAFDLRDIKAIA